MEITITGSGGAIRIPRPTCYCKTCVEARLKGFPYKRLGQSLFINSENILFDTPEDINEEINSHHIENINHIIYSHWHPDHTLGCRVIELIMDDDTNKRPINVYLPEDDIDISINKNSIFPYYVSQNWCNLHYLPIIEINNLQIERIILENGFSSAFLIYENGKKLLYCPCHVKDLPIIEKFQNVDLLIMNLGYFENICDDFTLFHRDNLRIIDDLEPKRTIFTHIEETNGLNYDDYKSLESKYENIEFSYDGMKIII